MTLALPHGFVGDPAVQANFEAIAQAINPPIPQARVYQAGAAQSIPNITITAVTFDSERWDEGGLHSTATNTSRLTAPVSGLYLIGGCVEFASSGAGAQRDLNVRINGATEIDSDRKGVAPTTPRLTVATTYRLAAGDYAELVAYQDSGGALNLVVRGNTSPEFWMVRLGGYTDEVFT